MGGLDEETAESAVDAAPPALVGGLEADAKDPAGEASLSKARATKDPAAPRSTTSTARRSSRTSSTATEEPVIATLGSASKADPGPLRKLLPILAPIVMAFLAYQGGRRREVDHAGLTTAEKESGGGKR